MKLKSIVTLMCLFIVSCATSGLKVSEDYHLITVKTDGRVVIPVVFYNDTGKDLKLVSYSKSCQCVNVSFPEGRELKKDGKLKALVETVKMDTKINFCFSGEDIKSFCSKVEIKKIQEGGNCSVKKVAVPLTPPKIQYNELLEEKK